MIHEVGIFEYASKITDENPAGRQTVHCSGWKEQGNAADRRYERGM